ncbi:hypothetical protein RR46_08612 [Papilio xuthus]|uniref:Uncharacterized protein n=1 Tax=Papilio xuthus TaxID=66420 RepID=A0A194Q9B7_PAPXU|nr:hypothetical protein RR46_08612 [Papilio xuthus]
MTKALISILKIYLMHSVDSVASYSSQNHVDRIRTQNFSAASCQDDADFGSIKTSLFRRSTSNLDYPIKRPDSVTSNTSSTRSRLRELVERKSSSEEHKPAANTVADIQYFDNPAETLEFDNPRNSLDSRSSQEERPKKKKQSKNKEKNKDYCEIKNKKHEKYQSKLAEYYKLPIQLPQDEFYQHLTRSRAAEELLQKRFSNSDTEFNGSYGRLCKHKDIEGSTNLRRSRSLAVIREETFTDLQIQNHAKNKRSQLIPRARLFDKPCFRDRLPVRAKYQTKEEVLEGIYIDSTASCFGDINRSKVDDIQDDKVQNGSGKEDAISQNESRRSQSIGGSWPNFIEESKQTNLSEDSIGHSRNPKLYIANNGHNGEIEEETRSKNKSPFHTEENISIGRSDKCVDDSILIHDKDDSYDEISIRSNKSPIQEIYDLAVVNGTNTSEDKDIDLQSVLSENDGTISSPPDSITSYISISIASSTDKSQKLEHLANSLAEKIDEYCDTHFNENNSVISNNINTDYHKNSDTDPIYTKVQKKTFADIKKDSLKNRQNKSPSNEIYVNNTYIENKNKKNSCTSTRNITTEPFVTTLIENQYFSLPDINISKCLRKSERIDAQLREEDKEDIPCENTYEIAHTNFKEILAAKSSEQYGHLNRPYNPSPQPATNTAVYVPEYKEANILNSFTKLDDDLESIVTIESSNVDDHDINYYNSGVHHQNEREINEIEGTIRNNKIITKAESLKLSSSVLRPDIKISKSLSNDNINKSVLDKNKKTNIRKHYSLRQRDPSNDNIRIPSPDTVEKTLHNCIETEKVKTKIPEEVKTNSLLSRVQSFKTSSESNITILPLSGHQTIVIDPPITKSVTDLTHINSSSVNYTSEILQKVNKEEKAEEEIKHNSLGPIETANFYIPTDPFITIKLNKVVKKTIPKLTNKIPDQPVIEEVKIDKPPSKLIIKDSNNSAFTSTYTKATNKMTRPQVIRVVDSKNKIVSSNTSTESSSSEISNTVNKANNNEKPEKKDDHIENKNDNKNDFTVKEKLHNAIKTDLEYQEKINSVKSYWSKLIEKPTEDHLKQEVTENEKSSPDNITTNVEVTVTKNDDTKYVPEISVGSIIKSLESVKIVDSIKKISQSTKKLQLWKEETEKVKSDSEIEEPTVQKIKKESEGTIYDTPKATKITKEAHQDISRDTPEIEIVELSSEDDQNQKTQATIIKAKGYEKGCDEFDHVRYKVMKSELFKNSMIANYRKEAQFDGLLQYLQDYSFQELLVNNNIVIIEPVRTKVEPTPKKNNNLDPCKIPSSLLKKNDNSGQID